MKLALYGYGGHAREVAAQMQSDVTFFVDDKYVDNLTHPIKPISAFNPHEYRMMIAIGDSRTRFDIVQKLPKETTYFTYIHPTALILSDSIVIGEGSFIGAYSILTTNIKIGKHALLNRANHIGHDSVIGDYFSAMPGAVVSGNATIYDCVHIGTNAAVKEGVTVHSLVTIGLNAGVVKSITEPGTYVGTPARLMR
jgi:sugar O-acyltransferase (sialic acid O-acetyltransferase NeuD family)